MDAVFCVIQWLPAEGGWCPPVISWLCCSHSLGCAGHPCSQARLLAHAQLAAGPQPRALPSQQSCSPAWLAQPVWMQEGAHPRVRINLVAFCGDISADWFLQKVPLDGSPAFHSWDAIHELCGGLVDLLPYVSVCACLYVYMCMTSSVNIFFTIPVQQLVWKLDWIQKIKMSFLIKP